jgi:thioredoxin-disulfide reductase
MAETFDCDALIVGGGAAGMTAGLYLVRKKLKTYIVTVDVGGQTNLTSDIRNYPSYFGKSGPELMLLFKKQAEEAGAEFLYGKVVKVEKLGEKSFRATMVNGDTVTSKLVILAFGKVAKQLGVPGEQKFLGRGVSTCVTCDGPLYRNKKAVIVGGGNSAAEGVLEMSTFASHVDWVHRSDKYVADAVTLEKIKNTANVTAHTYYDVKEISGDKFVTGAVIKNNQTGEEKKLESNGVFIEIGFIVDTALVKGLVALNEKNEILVNGDQETNVSGILAAGDCTNTPYKQTVISAGEGAKAALQAYRYFSGGKGVAIDWK